MTDIGGCEVSILIVKRQIGRSSSRGMSIKDIVQNSEKKTKFGSWNKINAPLKK
jgi:hypothetical protein